MNNYLITTIALTALTIYFFPFLIAWMRHHRQIVAIFWSNFFFGFTGVGWCVCFVWAVMK